MPLQEFSVILSELRRKLFYIAAVFGAGTVVSFAFMGEVIKKIQYDMFWRLNLPDNPDAAGQLTNISHNLSVISSHLAANNSAIAQNLVEFSSELLNISQKLSTYKPSIIYLTPMEVLMLEFKMSLIAGALIASPLIFYYAHRGLRGRFRNILPVNKWLLVSVLASSIMLFLLGAGYSYYYMLPFFLRFLYQDAISLGVTATFSIYAFISFVAITTVIIGLAFELPLVMALLVRLGITSRQTLAHYRRHAYIILLIVAAVITPDPTMFSQIMVTVPFIVLYEVSLLVMRAMGR